MTDADIEIAVGGMGRGPAADVYGGGAGVPCVTDVAREESGLPDGLMFRVCPLGRAGTRRPPDAPLGRELLAQLRDAPGQKAARRWRDAVLAQPPALLHHGDERVAVARQRQAVGILPVEEVIRGVLRFDRLTTATPAVRLIAQV